VVGATLVALVLCVGATLVSPGASAQLSQQTQSLDGSGNNRNRPDWGRAGTAYTRVAAARYADGRSRPVSGPNSRFVSNRIFNDANQNLFSENGISQWGFTWGQFLDHTFGLRDEAGTVANIPFDQGDPLESFTNTLGAIPFTRSAATPGTGVSNARQQTNTVSSYIDAWAVYGGTDTRLDWLREGSNDGNPNNNSARLLLDPNRLLPRRDARGNAATAPTMAADGRLTGQPGRAMVAGDVRANENIALTATHTLFAREHNRIVGLLPRILSEDTKFAIARRIVIAEQQWITYNEFLPSLGVRLPTYQGYNPNVNANLGNEFATVGYRAHSMIHGEIELETDAARYTDAERAQLEAMGVEIIPSEEEPGVVELVVPLNVAFFNPDLVGLLELGPLLQGIGLEAQYKNDEQIDNQLRSVLFQVPVSGNPGCLDGPELPECFEGVVDLGAIDIERGRDHGMPTYNQLRNAFGLPSRTSFRAVTGEATELFPADPELTPGDEINDPNSLDFVRLIGRDGQDIPLDSEEAESSAVQGLRRTSTAARLRAVYGSVGNLDAFTGMISEPHVAGTEFGELQLAMWRRQFQALRDGDRFFYGNDPNLNFIRLVYGIDFRRSLGDIIALNTDIPRNELEPNVFLAPVD
jgi:Animal haem peroxidase